MPKLTWNEIEDAAKEIFAVWVGQPELRFAKAAWKHLERAKLTQYTTPLEETQVKIRLLTLGCVYMDFCDAAMDDHGLPSFSDWMAALHIELFRVAQLVGTTVTDCNNAEEESEFCERALIHLTDRCRPDIHRALVDGYGGINQLYSALSTSNLSPKDARLGGEWEVTGENTAGFIFVSDGFARLRCY